MRDYAELVKALRYAFEQPCYDCVLGEKCNWGDFCFFKIAADAIEELLGEAKHWELEAAANETDRNYLIDENRKLVNSLMNFRVPTWISAKKPPEKPDFYWCNIENTVFPGRYYQEKLWYDSEYFVNVDGIVILHVTHYMPLPAPPTEEDTHD